MSEVSHKPGEVCPVVKRAVEVFGEEEGMGVLFNFTCFPMCDETAAKQLESYIRVREKVLDRRGGR